MLQSTLEKSSDFIGKEKTIILENGLKVKVYKPNLKWWYDFFIPTMKRLQWSGISPAIQKRILTELPKGKLSPQTVSQMPLPMVELILEVVAYYIPDKDTDWCKENLDIADFFQIIEVFLEVADVKRVMDFFVKISQRIPLPLLIQMAKGV